MSTEVNMNNQTKQKRPNYTVEFKQDAAKLVNEKGYTPKQAADNQERQHFSRKLKWGTSDFSSEKFAAGYCLRRPAFVLLRLRLRRTTPLRYAARH